MMLLYTYYKILWQLSMLASMLIIHAVKKSILISYRSPVACVCVLCASIHTVAPDVLLKYSVAEVVGGSWMECSRCLGLSNHQVHDMQSWYTMCVERSYTVLGIFHEQCDKKWKNFVTEMEKKMSYREFWKEETTGVWKICVSSLVHALIKGHMRKLILLRMYYASGCVDTSLTQDLFRSL